MTPEQQQMLIEVSVKLQRVLQDLEQVEDLQREIRALPDLKDRLEAIYHCLYIGDGESHPPLTQQVAFVDKRGAYLAKKVDRLAAARTLGPKERGALYVALIAALGGAVKHYLNAH